AEAEERVNRRAQREGAVALAEADDEVAAAGADDEVELAIAVEIAGADGLDLARERNHAERVEGAVGLAEEHRQVAAGRVAAADGEIGLSVGVPVGEADALGRLADGVVVVRRLADEEDAGAHAGGGAVDRRGVGLAVLVEVAGDDAGGVEL